MTDSSSIASSLSKTISLYEKVTLLVNCAGIAEDSPIATETSIHSMELYEKIIKINLLGTIDVCRQVSKQMISQTTFGPDNSRGVIINVSSICGTQGAGGFTAYSASKGGILGLNSPLSKDLAPYGIRVMCIAPGSMETPMNANYKDAFDLVVPLLLIKRYGTPWEFAHTVRYIAENGYLTGRVISLDGGLSL